MKLLQLRNQLILAGSSRFLVIQFHERNSNAESSTAIQFKNDWNYWKTQILLHLN